MPRQRNVDYVRFFIVIIIYIYYFMYQDLFYLIKREMVEPGNLVMKTRQSIEGSACLTPAPNALEN